TAKPEAERIDIVQDVGGEVPDGANETPIWPADSVFRVERKGEARKLHHRHGRTRSAVCLWAHDQHFVAEHSQLSDQVHCALNDALNCRQEHVCHDNDSHYHLPKEWSGATFFSPARSRYCGDP